MVLAALELAIVLRLVMYDWSFRSLDEAMMQHLESDHRPSLPY